MSICVYTKTEMLKSLIENIQLKYAPALTQAGSIGLLQLELLWQIYTLSYWTIISLSQYISKATSENSSVFTNDSFSLFLYLSWYTLQTFQNNNHT